jgi:hypothetical protein
MLMLNRNKRTCVGCHVAVPDSNTKHADFAIACGHVIGVVDPDDHFLHKTKSRHKKPSYAQQGLGSTVRIFCVCSA